MAPSSVRELGESTPVEHRNGRDRRTTRPRSSRAAASDTRRNAAVASPPSGRHRELGGGTGLAQAESPGPPTVSEEGDDVYRQLGRLSAEFLRRGTELLGGDGRPAESPPEPVVITGAALGLPGADRVFDDHNVARILHGEQFIDVIPSSVRHEMLDRRITRLVKGKDGSANFESIDDVAEAVGLQTAMTLRHHFRRAYGTTPTEYRRRFSVMAR